MPYWEYRKIDLGALDHPTDEVEVLNAAGEDGWDVVQITANNVAYLKRNIEPSNPAKPRRQRSSSSSG
jgi:hypothetical protein